MRYCILNILKYSYGNNQISIIIVYIQATDNNIKGMPIFINENNIDANFINVLTYLEPFYVDELIKETLEKCKNVLKGEMFRIQQNKNERRF